ncbi:MAG: DUF2314 domain-containing protein [Pirellulales bacterium]|nr:DUF2314 domain-containing protein [Pirellulales bacterium]
MVWIILGIVVVLGAGGGLGYLWWRRKKKGEQPLIAIVGLLREPMSWDAAVLARAASRAFEADLGDGNSEGEDGFVAGAGVGTIVKCRDRWIVVNCFPQPYTDDVEQAAEDIDDVRIRTLFRQHTAWFSCDALNVEGRLSVAELTEWYRWLGRLFAELLDDNCLLVFLPEGDYVFPVNEDTEAALRSADPLAALVETDTIPISEVEEDDPQMQKAVAEARARWPEFVSAYEQGVGEGFCVKAPVTAGDNTEFIWILVTAIEGDRIYGTLNNDPVNLGKLKCGSKVSVPIADLNDWIYLDTQQQPVGGFTVDVVQKASQRKRRRG